MGFDMYLERETYVKNWSFTEPEELYEITVKKGGVVVDTIDTTKIKAIVEEIGYWRKANAIHNWFVNNVQNGVDDCQRSIVDNNQLNELLDLVNKVLSDNSLAPELLPSQSGFFFGGTEYDEWYFKDLESTKVILEAAIQQEHGDIYYQASW